ncbi:hypothetical protein [Virgisporangium aurantiacum]|uniref:Uncharacterized protein n=1 Tax=Virgisporangium aurantiacum TaxID=175570 RepID=A0A8J3ZFP4_9ACTN|nr:hypothetical protein [Virgisporangium aurantiacum]GIJ63089.1 hypothetical protein Vau01_106050 [Virgisporangium aurantiacum]
MSTSLVAWVSEGVNNTRGDFELEVFNGRNRSTGPDFPDNEGSDPPGTLDAPEPPLVIAAGPQFTASSLKVDVIDNVPSPPWTGASGRSAERARLR